MADGIQFGRYTLVDRIATGGMAELFLARVQGEGGFEKTCVIKRVLPHLAGSPGFTEMFLDEARLVARLEHPSIVQILDVGRQGDDYFLAMEYLAGEDLSSILGELRMQSRQMPFDVAAKIIAVVCEAMHYAHQATGRDGRPLNIVHRDISPSNVLVTYQGAVKLLDFGIARAEHRLEKTEMGTVKGKQPYMSPEQSLGKDVDRRSDVWALGVCLWELLTGRRLFTRDSPESIRRAVLLDPIPRPSQLRPDVPVALEATAMAALERDVNKRLPSADAMRGRLEEFLADKTYVSSTVQLAGFLKTLFGLERMDSRVNRKPPQRASGMFTAPLISVEGATSKHDPSVPTEPEKQRGASGAVVRGALIGLGLVAALGAGWVLKSRDVPVPVVAVEPMPPAPEAAPAKPVAVASPEPAPLPALIDLTPTPEPAAPAAKSVRAPGVLNIESSEPAEVSVDGKRVGPAPQKLKVSPGVHTVQLTSASFGRAPSARVTARAGESTAYRETFVLGRLNVSVKPWADVFLDGAKIGQTPLAGRPAAAGTHQLKLVAPSGEKTLEITVPNGASVSVNETIP